MPRRAARRRRSDARRGLAVARVLGGRTRPMPRSANVGAATTESATRTSREEKRRRAGATAVAIANVTVTVIASSGVGVTARGARAHRLLARTVRGTAIPVQTPTIRTRRPVANAATSTGARSRTGTSVERSHETARGTVRLTTRLSSAVRLTTRLSSAVIPNTKLSGAVKPIGSAGSRLVGRGRRRASAPRGRRC